MEYRTFGPTKEKVSVIGEGTWYIEESDANIAISAIQCGLDLGMNHIDTAELYGRGKAEKIVGEAISRRRSQVFLVSKVQPGHASKKGTITACEGSLSRLGTDHLDCYLLHWPGSHPLEETIRAFEELKREGKILSWGLSNFDVPDLERAYEIAGKGNIACDQVLYNLNDRAIEHALIPWCEKHDITVVAYSPFGHGDFPSSKTREGKLLQEIASSHNATPRQVALSFLTRRSSVVAIPKASTPKHVEENAGAATVSLTKDEIDMVDKAFPLGSREKLTVF